MLTIILASESIQYSGGAIRIVIATQGDKEIDNPNRFMTHLQVIEDNARPFCILGHYDMTLEDALRDFNERYELRCRLGFYPGKEGVTHQ